MMARSKKERAELRRTIVGFPSGKSHVSTRERESALRRLTELRAAASGTRLGTVHS